MENTEIVEKIEELLINEFYPLQEKLHNSPFLLIEKFRIHVVYNRLVELSQQLDIKELGFKFNTI